MGTAVTRPEDPTRSGYAFMGWFIDSSYTTAYDFETPISGTTTIYAKWRQMYTVDFNTYGGSVVTPQVIPVNPPFTFGGWYTGIEMTETWDFNIPVTENRTFHARWLAGETDPDFAPGTPIAQAFTVAISAEWESARSAIASIGGGKNFIINVTGDVFSQPNSNYFSSGGGTLVIRGTGENRTMSLALNGSFFSVGSNQKVLLRDVTLKGRIKGVDGAGTDNTSSLINLGMGGIVEMKGTAKLTGNRGEAVYSSGGGGTFVMWDDSSITGINNSAIYMTAL